MDESGLTHLDEHGAARMVDVDGKAVTERRAVAEATVRTTADVVRLIAAGDLPKGDALPTARIAGIMGAKQTSALIPLCHPLPVTSADVRFDVAEESVRIVASVTTTGRTGVEMEALTAASVSALTLYDMIKAVDRTAVIDGIRLLAKSGGASGDWTAP